MDSATVGSIAQAVIDGPIIDPELASIPDTTETSALQQKIDTPIPPPHHLPPPPYYPRLQNAFSAPHATFMPPHHLLDVGAADVFSVSRERTSHARGADELEPGHVQYHNPAMQRFRPDAPMVDGDMTREDTLEANAARALEELAQNRGAISRAGHSIDHRRSSQSTTPIDYEHDGSAESDPTDDREDVAFKMQHGGIVMNGRPLRTRKARSTAPVPVPNLTKPSRGRRVPTAAAVEAVPVGIEVPRSPGTPRSGSVRRGSGNAVDQKSGPAARTYVCQVDGCGKAFRRGEHLKRHVRSLHTHEKPERCTYPGCGKEFSRRDNMQQHLKIHGHNHGQAPMTAPTNQSEE